MQAEGVRQAEKGHLESPRRSCSECGVSGPRGGGVNVGLASRVSVGFPSTEWGTSATGANWDRTAGNLRGLCPWARTPLSLRRHRQQNLALSAPPRVPGGGTGGPAAWSDLEKVKQASEVVRQHGAGGAARPQRKQCV